jgi:hypothetical protein
MPGYCRELFPIPGHAFVDWRVDRGRPTRLVRVGEMAGGGFFNLSRT